MKSLKTALLATAFVALMSTSALAAATMEASNDWTGPYIGLQLGAGSGVTTSTDLDGWWYQGRKIGTDDGAFIGGAKIGYDMAEGSMIYGLLAEYSFSNIDTEKEVSAGSPRYKAGSDIKGLGSVRAKLGVASGDVAGFVTAGLAYQNADDRYTETDGTGETINSNSDRLGWAFGLGTEYAIGNNGFIGLDASRYIFGKKRHEILDSAGVGQDYFFDFENTVTTGTISYTYKFN